MISKSNLIQPGKWIKNTTLSTSRFFSSSHAWTIILLVIVILGFNLSQTRATADSNFITTNNEDTIAVAQEVAPYTPLIEENSDQLAQTLNGEDNGFLHKPTIQETAKNPSIYTVQNGDTISSIAQDYGVTIATVLDANNIKSSDISNVKPGTNLTIPPYSTTESLSWLDDINRIKAEKAAKEEADRKVRELAAAKNKRLALGNSRNVSYRESSSTRQVDSSPFTGESGGGMIVPIQSKGISRGIGGGHTGIDYRADVGTPVQAGRTGKVSQITGGWAGGWGTSVVLDHGNGVTTRYAHLSKSAVSAGETVSQGSIVGYSGNSGFSTGPHLHFEMRVNGRVANPYK